MSDVVPRRDTGTLVTVTRCEFTWSSLLVSMRAVPSVGGTNVHVNIRSPWFISLANALAFVALVVFGSPAAVVVAIVLVASITLVVRRVTRLMKAVESLLAT